MRNEARRPIGFFEALPPRTLLRRAWYTSINRRGKARVKYLTALPQNSADLCDPRIRLPLCSRVFCHGLLFHSFLRLVLHLLPPLFSLLLLVLPASLFFFLSLPSVQLKGKEDDLQRERAELSRVTVDLEFSEGERCLVANRVLNSEERARAARREARVAKERASTVEARAAAVKKEVSTAMEAYKNSIEFVANTAGACMNVLENYKNSADFHADATAAATCVDVYSIDFYDCKKLVEDTFLGLDLRAIVAPSDETEEEEAEVEGEAVEVLPTPEAPPTSEVPTAKEEEGEVVEIPPVSAASLDEVVLPVADIPSTSGASQVAEASRVTASPRGVGDDDDDDVVEIPGKVAAPCA